MKIWLRAGFGALAMGFALGCSITVSEAGWGGRIVPALACAVVVILLIRPVRRRQELGLQRAGRGLLSGLLVTGGSAVVVLGAGTVAGWITWGHFELHRVLLFLLTNTVIALLLEALPEELSLRGHTWSALRSRYGGLLSAVGTTALFLLVPGIASAVQLVLGTIFEQNTQELSLVPPGEDPVAYLFLLTIFGFTLIAARAATGSLWASVATHLTFLTVNRLTVDRPSRYWLVRDAGWSATVINQDVLLLVPAYLVLAAVVYYVQSLMSRPALSLASSLPQRDK
ncbi:CPBP family intramembrane metalloprotease [Kribbella antibiotica]|uniref:CPBP family intramembrane metalloprotease n=1 Tax=Kribbella antibiotica TaxID=190195 RepID=A0A4R4ZD94_9ACTN|nr:CPBP family glutamic-type intramembrane protease [Kribbella antibiotica]TDD55434.1 CPBP family intramembrane metalloprotease [Kribbella antibiotica]